MCMRCTSGEQGIECSDIHFMIAGTIELEARAGDEEERW